MSLDISKKLQYRHGNEIAPEIARYKLDSIKWLIVFQQPNGLYVQAVVTEGTKPYSTNIEQANLTVPWKDIKSVPVNCWFRFKRKGEECMFTKISSIHANSVYLYGSIYNLNDLFKNFEYTKSTNPFDPNNVWLPCGEIES